MKSAYGIARHSSVEFPEWVRPHLKVMRRVAAARSPQLDPDDIVQEALARAWLKRNTYSAEKGSERTWLLAIVADQARRAARRRQQHFVLAEADTAGGQSDLDLDVDLRRAVSLISPRQREAIVLFYYVDLPVAEVAALMKCSEGTVKSTLADARLRLAALLKEHE